MKPTEKKPNGRGVVLSTITFYPEISGTGQILTDLALSLAEKGMSVRVYTAQPHYYEKHERLPAKENYGGVEIRRITSTTLNKNNRLGRILNWSSFALSAFFKLLRDPSRYPYLIVSSPPVLPYIGWLVHLLTRKPYILLIHDVYPDIGVKLGFFRKNGPTVWLWKQLNKLAYRGASKIIVLASDMAPIVALQMGKKSENGKIQVIHNWADESFIHPFQKGDSLFLQQNPVPFRFLVQYSGNLGFNHDLEPLIEAARRFQGENIGFLFIGEGGKKEKLQALVRAYGLSNVLFFPFQSRDLLPHLLCASDLSVVTLEQGLEGLAVPSKFYSILASGRPLLALLGENCEMAQMIRKYQCGFVVPQGNTEAIVQILKQCTENPAAIKTMGENARRCFLDHYTRAQAAQKYQEILTSVTAG